VRKTGAIARQPSQHNLPPTLARPRETAHVRAGWPAFRPAQEPQRPPPEIPARFGDRRRRGISVTFDVPTSAALARVLRGSWRRPQPGPRPRYATTTPPSQPQNRNVFVGKVLRSFDLLNRVRPNEGVTCPVICDPQLRWQGIFAAPSCRRRRSPAGSGLRGVGCHRFVNQP
jgi:hypothetical protein